MEMLSRAIFASCSLECLRCQSFVVAVSLSALIIFCCQLWSSFVASVSLSALIIFRCQPFTVIFLRHESTQVSTTHHSSTHNVHTVQLRAFGMDACAFGTILSCAHPWTPGFMKDACKRGSAEALRQLLERVGLGYKAQSTLSKCIERLKRARTRFGHTRGAVHSLHLRRSCSRSTQGLEFVNTLLR